MPGLEKWVFPELEERLRRPRKAPQRHETLPAMLDEMADRYDLAVALQRTEADGLSRISFREWREQSLACAARLQALGVKPGDRVLLAGANHPAWPIAFFGILWPARPSVPLDANIEADVAAEPRRAFPVRECSSPTTACASAAARALGGGRGVARICRPRWSQGRRASGATVAARRRRRADLHQRHHRQRRRA